MTISSVTPSFCGVDPTNILTVSTNNRNCVQKEVLKFHAPSDVFQLVIANSKNSFTGCEKDTDCKGARVCEGGVCVEPRNAPTQPGEETHNEPDLSTLTLQLIDAERELAELQRAKKTGTILYVASGVFLLPAAALLIYWVGDDVTPLPIPITGAIFGGASVASLISGALVYPSQSEFAAVEKKIEILQESSRNRTHGSSDTFGFRLGFKF